jgi:hypothetical protein
VAKRTIARNNRTQAVNVRRNSREHCREFPKRREWATH